MAAKIELPEDLLRRWYVADGLSSMDIAKSLGCHPLTVRARMRDFGIPLRPKGWHKLRRHVPEALLDSWPSETLAYVVGLVAADGNLPKRNNCIVFSTAEQELAQLFASALGVADTHVVRVPPRPPRKGAFIVQVCDHALRAFIEMRGLTPNKALTIGRLDVPDSVFCDFLRGEMDGDGGWFIAHGWRHVEYLVAKFTSKSSPYLQWLQATVLDLTGLEGRISGYALVFNGHKAERLGEWLYYEKDLPCLQRKQIVWSNWMQHK